MNWYDVALGLLTLGAAAAGWFLRQLWDAVQELKEDLHGLENDVRTNFARRDDVREMFQDLLNAVRRVEDKLDFKQDK